MKRSIYIALALSLAAILLILIALPQASRVVPGSAAPDPQQVVQRAWELAKQAGSYRFVAQVDQFYVPLPTPLNVGKASRQQSARLEGTTNLAERKMEFTLFAEGGSALDAQSGTQIKVEGDRAYSRQGQQAWQEIDDFTTSLAPQSDVMAFLSGAKNISLAESAREAGLAHYTFEVNGHGFADYMESQLTEQMAARAELPPGAMLNLKRQFASMSGTGEIWIGADGLPVRQVLHLQFPPTSQDQVQADVQVTFTGFDPLPAAVSSSLSQKQRWQRFPSSSFPEIERKKVFMSCL